MSKTATTFAKAAIIMLLTCALLTPAFAGSGAKKPALDRKNMDTSVKPGENFYRYANGGFIDSVKMPDDRSRYTAIDMVREDVEKELHDLLIVVSKIKGAKKGTAAQQISDLFASGMDEKAIEAAGIKPLTEDFARIEKIKTLGDVQDVIAYFHQNGAGVLFGTFVYPDLMKSTHYRYYLWQGGIGLSDVEYYYKDDKRSKEIRQEYLKFAAKMFGLLGDKPEVAEANAKTIMTMETRLAKSSKTRLEMRNMPALYNKRTVAQLQEMTPGFEWKRYFKNICPKTDFGDPILGSPKFFDEIGRLMKDVPVKDWKTYLRWNLVRGAAGFLSSDFVNANYDFYSAFMTGSKKIRPRWKRVTQMVTGTLGDLVGQLYVEKHFPPTSKKRMQVLVSNLKKALKKRIQNLKWMSDATKKEALAKLEKMRVKIGYPDKWRDYSKMDIQRDHYVLNARRAGKFLYYRDLADLGKPVDPERWGMSPQTVNAGYSPVQNEIIFPAGILQPPMFNPDADDAVNYGAIGVVIGHEMTHGFDDQGRRFDKDGNLKDWWTKEDAEKFTALGQLLIDQYNEFVAIDDVKVDGKLTLGENIADFGGLTIALEAYNMSLEGKPAPKDIDGFNHMQRFFLSYSQVWRGKVRDEMLKRLCKEDVHPWGKFRVNGPLFNVPEFYKTFDIKATDKLYRTPAQRPVIW